MGKFDTIFGGLCVGGFVFLMGIAANISEVESIFFIDFRKELSTVGTPTTAIAEVAIIIMALTLLAAGVLFVVSEK